MNSISGQKVYKSPRRKLVKFFEKSRDQWKSKCLKAKKQIKYFKNRIRYLEESKSEWKDRAKRLAAELSRMKAEQRAVEKEMETEKKKV